MKKILFSLFTVILFFILVEGVLRLAGMGAKDTEQKSEASQDLYEPLDDRVFVQLRKKTTFKPYPVTYSPRYDVALRGSREYGPKLKNRVRIICMGDSCTYLGMPSYPELTEKALAECGGEKKTCEVINAGIEGLSSFWGYQLLNHALIHMEPDIVTVYLGWNDHWSSSMRDKIGRELELKKRQWKWLYALSEGSRLYGLLKNLLLADRKQDEIPYQETLFRKVPLDDFSENLQSIISLCRKKGARVILITPPHALDIKEIPSFLMSLGKVSSREELIALHESYIRAVRMAAGEQAVALLDLAALFQEEDREALMKGDGIHLTPEGLQYIGMLLCKKILKMEGSGTDRCPCIGDMG